jgi:ABC-type sugar transport systems, permease components
MMYYQIGAPSKYFIGLENYKQLVTDPEFLISLKNTFIYVATYVPAVILLSLILALLLNTIHRGAGIYRAIYFAPVMTAGVAVAIIWRFVLHPSLGPANQVLRALGLPPSDWLVGASTAMPSMVLVSVWQSMGFQTILFLAGLKGIPQHFYDAAKIDGAGRWQCFRHITWPLLQHTTLFVTITTIIGSFQIFTLAYLFGRMGGPGNSLLVVVSYIQHEVMSRGNLGYASAIAVVLFVIILFFTVMQLKVGRVRWQY